MMISGTHRPAFSARGKMVEIAAAGGVSQPTISRRVEQALLSLRERLRLKGVLVAAGVLGGCW